MFDRKSDYALNKRHHEAIVYRSVTQEDIYLTSADFSSREEFDKWKKWSDLEYRQVEVLGRRFYDKWMPLDDRLEDAAEPSAEEQLIWMIDRADWSKYCAKCVKEIESCLSPAQFRRLRMRYVEGKRVTEIAESEGISKAGISQSIRAAREKIKAVFLGT